MNCNSHHREVRLHQEADFPVFYCAQTFAQSKCTRQRFHNATGTGELTTPSGSQPKARVTYMAMYADEIGRQLAVANYGTYGGAAFSRASVVPSRTDTILVTSTEYDDAGQAYKTIDPAGREDRQVFDDAGRVTKTIQNYTDGNPTTGNADEDVTVEMTYNADGQLSTLTAKNPTTGDQTTTYVYGTTLTDSEIATSTLKRAEIYPDSDDTTALGDGADSTYDRIEFKYDRQQRITEVKDQQETLHAFDFDALGRQTQDRVTSLGSGVDGEVRRIATEYDVLGRRSRITSYDNPTVGSGSIVNDLAFVYDNFGQLVTEYQEHGGAVNTGTSLKVQYAYADGSSNTIRLTKMTYPDGRELNYSYGSSGSTDDALSRVASLIDDDGSTHLVDYSYLGAGAIVQADYAQPDVRCDLAHGAGNDPYDGPMDRFGRVTDLLWYDYGSSADLLRFKHGYDRASNRLYREEADTSDLDQLYVYDDVNRLVQSEEGTLSVGKDSISSLNFKQQWALDATGNWSGFKEDDDGDSSWDLEQTRTSNAVNEITDVAETTGPSWITPAYNRAGNMTTIPQPGDPTQSYAATYDAWNRLVKLEEGEDTVAEYVFDGAKRLVVRKKYASGSLSHTRHFYHTAQWQTIEERLESSGVISANPDRQFVWGLRYIDDLALRDHDTDSNGSLDERLYALQDANWNVTALADTRGDVQERYAYSAYGVPNVLTPTFTTRASSSFATDVLYAGYRYEQATELFHIRHRVYQPALGCWVQRDPMQYGSHSGSSYRYAQNAPFAFADPLGLFRVSSDPVPPPPREPRTSQFNTVEPTDEARRLKSYLQWMIFYSRMADFWLFDFLDVPAGAVNALDHFLSASGTPLRANLLHLRDESDTAKITFYKIAEDAVAAAKRLHDAGQLPIGQRVRMVQGWQKGIPISREDSRNWFGVFRGWSLFTEAFVSATNARCGFLWLKTCCRGHLKLTFTVFKEFNFDPGEAFNVPGLGPMNAGDLDDLHAMGLAQNYDIWGRMTSMQEFVWDLSLPTSGGQTLDDRALTQGLGRWMDGDSWVNVGDAMPMA